MADVQYPSASLGKRCVIHNDQVEMVLRLSLRYHRGWLLYIQAAEGGTMTWSEVLDEVLGGLNLSMRDAGIAVVPPSTTAIPAIVRKLSDVERRKCEVLITNALRQDNWDPLIRYGAYQPTFEALVVIN